MTKVWVKTKFDGASGLILPHSEAKSAAMAGFSQLGAELVPYQKITDIYDSVTKEDIVLDYIDPCIAIFQKFGVYPFVPDYPEVLSPFLGRKIWKDTANHIANEENLWKAGYFIKPLKSKAFTGKIINSIKDLIGCGIYGENPEVLVSEPLNILAEWRAFILYDEIIDIRPYDSYASRLDRWKYHYDSSVVEEMLKAFCTYEERPVSCSMDICRTKDGRTLLVECNDCYALGDYGLPPVLYAKMISARWAQLLQREDEYDFRKYR